MKIAMLTNNYKPFMGGVPISVERQARHLALLGHEVTVFAPDFRNGETGELVENLRVVRFKSGAKEEHGMVYPRFIMPEILNEFKENEFDCIHVHHPMFVGNTALYLKKKYGIPVIYTYHTNYEDYLHYLKCFQNVHSDKGIRRYILQAVQKIVPKYMKWFLHKCNMIFAPTKSIEEYLLDRKIHTPIRVFPTGLEESFYQPNVEQSAEIRYQYGKNKKWMFITIGRLEIEKNPEFLLRGLEILGGPEYLGTDFQMLFIGSGSLLKKLRIMAKSIGLEEQVTFVGDVSNEKIKDFLYASDLFLFASLSETQGIVLAEAFATETPVVAVRAQGVNDIVKSGYNGFVTEENLEEWADKVMEALETQRLNIFQKNAKVTAQEYRAAKLSRQEEMLYKECISSADSIFNKKSVEWAYERQIF